MLSISGSAGEEPVAWAGPWVVGTSTGSLVEGCLAWAGIWVVETSTGSLVEGCLEEALRDAAEKSSWGLASSSYKEARVASGRRTISSINLWHEVMELIIVTSGLTKPV